MNATTSLPATKTVLKFGAVLFVGWLCLWLTSGVVMWLASRTYEGMSFIFLCGLYGFTGAAVFAVLAAWQYRRHVLSPGRSAITASLAGVLALPAVWHILREWPVEHLGWVCFAAVALGVAFGLLLRWLSNLLCRSQRETFIA